MASMRSACSLRPISKPGDDMSYTLEGIKIKHVTDLAFLVLVEGEEIWIPFSHVESPDADELVKGYEGDVEITDWIAKQKGFTE